MNLEHLDEILRLHDYEESGVIAMLQDIQKVDRYLPQRHLRLVGERVGVGASRIYGLATFYKAFSLKPRGRHIIKVCMGTACHVKGGARIMDRLSRDLGVQPGETTRDGQFTLESVRCVGCCGLAPVVMIGGEFHGKLTQQKLPKLLKQCASDPEAAG